MKHNYLNIYNNLIKLTRNKTLYIKLEKQDTFSHRLIFLFFHLSLFFKHFKNTTSSKNLQEFFDFTIKQIELSIRELGHGDVTVNKNMKKFINIFYSIIDQIETLDLSDKENQLTLIKKYLNTDKNLDFYVEYFNKYRVFLSKNTLNYFTKDIINLNF